MTQAEEIGDCPLFLCPLFLTLLRAVDAWLQAARKLFDELAESRTGDPRLQAQIVDQFMRWFVHGRNAGGAPAAVPSGAAEDSDEAA